MRFADARRPQEDDILAALDEAELVQALHLLPTQRRLEREIKVVELFDDGQSAGPHRGLQPSVVAQLNLRSEELLDRFGGGQRTAVDALEDRVECFEAAGHPQIGEHVPQAIAAREGGALHAAPPVSCAYAASDRFSTVTSG